MALPCDSPWLGDIGDEEPDVEPDPDRVYGAAIERAREVAEERGH